MDPATLLVTILFTALFVGIASVVLFKNGRMTASTKGRRLLQRAQATLRRNPQDRNAMANIADLYYKAEEWRAAYQVYFALYGDQAVVGAFNTQAFQQYLQYAIAAYRDHRIDHAYRLLSQAKRSGIGSFEYYKYFGLCAYEKKEFPLALSCFQSAHELQPTDLTTRTRIALTHYQLGNISYARGKLQALSGVGHDPDVQYALGNIYLLAGEQKEAVATFSQLAKINSHAVSALIMLGDISHKQRNLSQALSYYTRASKLSARVGTTLEVEILHKISLLLVELNKSTTALKHLREIELLSPDYKNTRQLIARISLLLEDSTMKQYLRSPAGRFHNIANTLIPLLLRAPVSNITTLHSDHSTYQDYRVQMAFGARHTTEKILFRFVRTQGISGELSLRDFYEKMNAERFARGVFVTAGQFSDEAQNFAVTKTITLYSGDRLRVILKNFKQPPA